LGDKQEARSEKRENFELRILNFELRIERYYAALLPGLPTPKPPILMIYAREKE